MTAAALIERVVTVADGDAHGIVASPEQLRAWLVVAKAGDRFVYATRAWLPVGHPGAAFARQLQAQGLVNLTCPRSKLVPGAFSYYAERTSRPVSDARGPAEQRSRLAITRVRPADGEAALIDRLLPLLERTAQYARPCPSDNQLAERARMRPEQVQPTIDAMRAANLIRVYPAPAPTLRRVAIVATGHMTGIVV